MEVIYNLENHASCLPSAKAAGVQSTYSVCCATEKLAALGTAWPLSLKGLFSGSLGCLSSRACQVSGVAAPGLWVKHSGGSLHEHEASCGRERGASGTYMA